MAVHLLKNIQKIPGSIEKVWEFYATPVNLQQLTPDDMGFSILSGDEQTALYEGQVFEYKVSPVLGIPLYWKTAITKVEAPYHFIDFQQKGPYKFWEHQHFFKPVEGGVEMTDIVRYQNPLWLLGDLANIVLVRKRLREIFEFRFNKMVELFGPWPGGQEINIAISRL